MTDLLVTRKACRVSSGLIATILLGFALVGCSSDGSEDGEAPAGSGGPPPAAVVADEVVEDYLITTETFFAQVRSRNSASLSPSAPGEVIEVNVREGDRVDEGTVLVRVNSRSASANLQQLRSQLAGTQVQLEQARRDAERARTLADRAIGSGQAAEQAEAQASNLQEQLSSIRASITAQQQSVSDHVVRAPFSGVITSRTVDLGDFVQPGTTVLELVSTDEIEVFVRLPQERIASLGADSAATLKFEQESIEARVEGIVGVLDASTRSGLVRLIPDSHPAWLIPGAALDVAFETQSAEKGLIIPLDAVVYGVARPRVMKIVDGQAQPVDITIVQTSSARALVRGEGLNAGDQIVLRGNERLRPGQAVNVQQPLDSEGGPEGVPQGSSAPTPPEASETREAGAQGDDEVERGETASQGEEAAQ